MAFLYTSLGCVSGYTDAAAWEMIKWFDTSDHYLLPELNSAQKFKADFSASFTQIDYAKKLI